MAIKESSSDKVFGNHSPNNINMQRWEMNIKLLKINTVQAETCISQNKLLVKLNVYMKY